MCTSFLIFFNLSYFHMTPFHAQVLLSFTCRFEERRYYMDAAFTRTQLMLVSYPYTYADDVPDEPMCTN